MARKRAAERSEPEPVFGLAEEVEGVLVGRGSNFPGGVVVEMEYRRKSGRGVGEWFFVPAPRGAVGQGADPATKSRAGLRERGKIILLDDHPLYRPPSLPAGDGSEGGGEMESGTFDLGLTEKQRRDREGVVLPYFDAQRGGGGEGGRILYEMGEMDDFDEEEDEI